MKSASFFCPYNSVFKVVRIAVERKGYIISFENTGEGLLKAHKRKNIFEKPKILDMMIYRIDHHSTGVRLMINSNARVFDRPLTGNEREEEKHQ